MFTGLLTVTVELSCEDADVDDIEANLTALLAERAGQFVDVNDLQVSAERYPRC